MTQGETPSDDRPSRTFAWRRRLGRLFAEGCVVGLVVLALVWWHGRGGYDQWQYRRAWPVTGPARPDGEAVEEWLVAESGFGVVAAYRMRSLKRATFVVKANDDGVLPGGDYYEQVPGRSVVLGPDDFDVGPLSTLFWSSRDLPPKKGAFATMRVEVAAVPAWLLMVPFAAGLLGWAWCPPGRAWPRLTLGRLAVVVASCALVVAGAERAWRGSWRGRAYQELVRMGGEFYYGTAADGTRTKPVAVRFVGPGVDDDTVVRVAEILRSLPSVKSLELTATRVGEAGAAALARVDHLTGLKVSYSKIPEAAALKLTGLRRLRTLDLAGCPNVGDATANRAVELPELRQLKLSGTGVTDAGLARLVGLNNLDALTLDQTGVTDAGLARLTTFPRLAFLGLRNCRSVTDAGVARLAEAPKLRALGLDRSPVTDGALEALERSGSLEHVTLSGTRVTAEAVERARKRKPRTEWVP